MLSAKECQFVPERNMLHEIADSMLQRLISIHLVTNRDVKAGVHLIVTIATIAEKSVSDHSDQMDTSLLTIPAIVTIAIAGKGSGSIPAIVTIAAIIWTQASDRERSERSSYFPRCTAVLVHFMLISISRQKNMILEVFLNDWNDQMDMTQRSFSDRRG